MSIALVSCLELLDPDDDEAPLLDALRGHGHDAVTIHWDDPSHDPGAFDACVLRATWNYHRRLPAFKAWLERAGASTRLINPLGTVKWNLHKKYLIELESRRIPVVPTAWVDRGEVVDVVGVCGRRGWGKVVIKPCVSGGSRETRTFEVAVGGEEAQAFLEFSAAREDTMIQRYMPSVERGGEVSIVCLGGTISHAVEKRARFAGEEESVRAKARISEAERRFVAAVLDACPVPAAYARVDIITGERGEIMLSELELIEPSLFFDLGAGSADRFVRVIESVVSRGGASFG